MEYLRLLDGAAPWWWIILAFVLGSIEMATLSFFLIWPALAALSMAGLLVVVPDMSGPTQISIFAVLSVVLTFVGRSIIKKYGDGAVKTDDTLNNRSAHLVGRSADVLEFASGRGVIEIEGMRWRAEWRDGETSAPGKKVRVIKADAMLLYVENAKS